MKPSVPRKKWIIRVTDMLTCIAKIRRYTKGHGVNLSMIWQTIKEDIPSLVSPLKRILEENQKP